MSASSRVNKTAEIATNQEWLLPHAAQAFQPKTQKNSKYLHHYSNHSSIPTDDHTLESTAGNSNETANIPQSLNTISCPMTNKSWYQERGGSPNPEYAEEHHSVLISHDLEVISGIDPTVAKTEQDYKGDQH